MSGPRSWFINLLLEDDEMELEMLERIFSNTQAHVCPQRLPCHTRPFSGLEHIHDILRGNSVRSHRYLRMRTPIYLLFKERILGLNILRPGRRVDIDEQLGIFLSCLGHGIGNRLIQETYQHSGETISRYFHKVLDAVLALKNEYIQLPPNDAPVHPKILHKRSFYPYFKDALGAIDGTHIEVIVPKEDQPRFRNRKNDISQNVIGVVSFDYMFMFLCVGWEGSAADMRVLKWSCEHRGFTVPEGYANTNRFLAPYRGTRYHLSTYHTSGRHTYDNYKDLYNHRHAQLRNCVEKAFGILKMRFGILQKPLNFPFETQKKIIIACCIIHNFIRQTQGIDELFDNPEQYTMGDNVGDRVTFIPAGRDESSRGEQLRDHIANSMYQQYISRRSGNQNPDPSANSDEEE